MQDRHVTAVDDVSHCCFDQISPISPSPIVGVSTHGTYFRISDGTQALSRHCDKPAVHTDPEVSAHLVCSTAKRSRLGDLDQGQHVGHIGGAEWDHMLRRHWTARRCSHHLPQRQARKSLKPTRRQDFSRAAQSDFLVRPKQRGKVLKARIGCVLDRGQWRNSYRITTSPPLSFGNVGMPGRKGEPYRVVENDVCIAQIRNLSPPEVPNAGGSRSAPGDLVGTSGFRRDEGRRFMKATC